MSILKYKDPKTGEFKRINPYKADMSFVGKDGIVVNKAANSEEIEISGSGCVQKVTDTTENRRVVTIEPNSNTYTTRPVSTGALVRAVAQRQDNGELLALVSNSPTDYTLTNKKYIADNYVEKVKFTNLEQALNGYILDTTKEAYANLDSAVLKNSVAVGDNVYPIADKTRALVTRIDGKTTKMVQLLDKSTYYKTQTKLGITATNNGDGSWTINGTATTSDYMNFSQELTSIVGGHKILICGNKENSNFGMGLINQPIQDTGAGVIGIFNQNMAKTWGIEWRSGAVINNVTITPQLFDLTAMNREDITTVEQFKAEFPDLYPYENGNIYPAKISGVRFTGKNLLDFNTVSIFGDGSYGMSYSIVGNEVHIAGTLTRLGAENIIKTSNLGLIGHGYTVKAFDIRGTSVPPSVYIYGLRAVDINGQIAMNFDIGGMKVGQIYDFYFKVMVSAIIPTAYEPYIEPVSVTLPETYDLHGIDNNKDYLEITKNENNELYTLKKVQSVEVNESEKTITPLATPVETVIATNLTYEQVTAIRHNGGLIEVAGNTNKAYAKPTIKNTVVYRLTATNTAEG